MSDSPLAGRTALVAGAGRSEIDRPETIEDTGDLVASVGSGTALVGGDRYAEWGKPLWEHGRLVRAP